MTKNPQNEYDWGKGCKGWVFLEDRDLSIIVEKIPPFSEEQNHFHSYKKQFFLVTKGVLSIYKNNSRFSLSTGEGLKIAAKEVHRVVNESGQDAEFVVIANSSDRNDKELVL